MLSLVAFWAKFEVIEEFLRFEEIWYDYFVWAFGSGVGWSGAEWQEPPIWPHVMGIIKKYSFLLRKYRLIH